MRLRLARRLNPVLAGAQDGTVAPDAAAARVLKIIGWHRRWAFLLSMTAVAVTALWGTLWQLMHPNGL
jgi:hypothetical protein